jgi:hypothetical protein
LPELLAKAIERQLVSQLDAVRLQKMHLDRVRLDDNDGKGTPQEAEGALELCIRVVDKHW